MAIRNLCFILACATLSLWANLGWSQSVSLKETQNAKCVIDWGKAHLYVREATGRNDGKDVESFQRVTGNRKGDAWCGSYQAANQKACGLPFPKGAGGSYNWFLASSPRTYYISGVRGSSDSIRPGHQIGFYNVYLKRIGHVGRAVSPTRVARRGNARGWTTNEGNTGTGGGREGAGVYSLLRANWEIYAASNWIN